MSSEPRAPFFDASQRRTIGFALTLGSLLASAALLVLAFAVAGRLVSFFSSVLWPLAVAGVMALILRPIVVLLEKRLGLRRLSAVVLLYGVFVLVAGGALVLIVPPVIEQLLGFVDTLSQPGLRDEIFRRIQEKYPQWVELAQRQMENPMIRNAAESIASEAKMFFSYAAPSLRAAFGSVIDVFAFITHIAIVPVYLFFFLLARGEPTRNLGRHLPFLRPGVRTDVVFLTSEFVSIVEAFFRGQILIGLCMGGLLAVGFTLVGLKFGLFIGLALGVLNIIPYLGTIIGLGVTLPLAFFQPEGGWDLLGLVILINIIVQCIEGWVLTPKIMGHHTGLHPVAIIVGIFFWGTAFGGVLGMLLAVPLTAFFVTAWRLAKQKYLKPVKPDREVEV